VWKGDETSAFQEVAAQKFGRFSLDNLFASEVFETLASDTRQVLRIESLNDPSISMRGVGLVSDARELCSKLLLGLRILLQIKSFQESRNSHLRTFEHRV
jgi:hypothetical protein